MRYAALPFLLFFAYQAVHMRTGSVEGIYFLFVPCVIGMHILAACIWPPRIEVVPKDLFTLSESRWDL